MSKSGIAKNILQLAVVTFFIFCVSARAETLKIAVAANFTNAARGLGAQFEADTGHNLLFSFGSTGKLFAQIKYGAPFDIFLSADMERATKTGNERLGLPETQMTYAVGRLALVTNGAKLQDGGEILIRPPEGKLALANPKLAPYGAAARDVLKWLGVFEQWMPFLVTGNSVAQAYQFVITGNASVGFVALSQLHDKPRNSYWLVPKNYHQPIRQDAILLNAGENSGAARNFMKFLGSSAARKIIARHGYDFDVIKQAN
ncbi:MAG: molybdate ABC transporter substrate-binding protein [Cohaesibacteraceae bacterium]|nr:molybdate ABC transporter substrate-binding protein [Cohaesibacteraceae bacterium]